MIKEYFIVQDYRKGEAQFVRDDAIKSNLAYYDTKINYTQKIR